MRNKKLDELKLFLSKELKMAQIEIEEPYNHLTEAQAEGSARICKRALVLVDEIIESKEG